MRGLNGKGYQKTSLTNFVGYLEVIRGGHFCLKIFIDVVARGLQTCQKHDFSRLWRPLLTKPLQIALQCTKAFSKYLPCTTKRHENIRSTSYRYGGAVPQKSSPKIEKVPNLAPSSGHNWSAILTIYGAFGRPLMDGKWLVPNNPPRSKCLKGSPYQKNVLANVIGHRKHMGDGWCFSQVPSFTIFRGPEAFSDFEISSNLTAFCSRFSANSPYKEPKR